MASRILPLPKRERVLELLNYDAETGVFTWAKTTGPRATAGSPAGFIATRGYRKIRVDGVEYFAHRLAWLCAKNQDPNEMSVDHIDGDTSNNSIRNLHIVTAKQNVENRKKQSNNSTGYSGVTAHKPTGKWQGRIKHNSKLMHVGLFDTPEQARDAVESKRKELFTNSLGRHLK